MADRRDILIRLLGEETVSRVAGKAGAGLDKLGDAFEATEADARGLDRQIEEVEDSLKALAVAYSRAQTEADRLDLTKAMRKQQSELRKMTKARDLLPDMSQAGDEAASGFGASFVAKIGPVLAKAPMGAPGAAIGAGLAAVVVPMLGASIAGAVIGGVGVGGVIGGLKIAAGDSRVKAAGAELSAAVAADLDSAGSAFVTPALQGITIIRDAWDDVQGDVKGVASATSRYVVPLARGVADAVRAIAPGVRAVSETAGPIVRELSTGIPRLGRAIGDVLTDLSDDADEGATAVRGLMMGLESGIRTTGMFVGGLADIYGGLVRAGQASSHFADGMTGWLPVIGDKVHDNRVKMDELAGALDAGGEAGTQAGDDIFGGLMKAAGAATEAAVEVKLLDDRIRELTDKNFAARSASRELEAAIDDATAAFRENGKTLDETTPKGRDNAAALDAIAAKANDAYQASLDLNEGQDAANKKLTDGRAAFLRMADAMGMDADKAKILADRLFAIPSPKPTITVKAQQALDAIAEVTRNLSGVKNKNVTIGVWWKSNGDLKVPGGTLVKGASRGGPVRGRIKGVDTEPFLLADGEHVIPDDEVDAAGGHAGIERIRAALRGEARMPAMAGASASGGGGHGGGHRTYSITVNVPPGANPAETGRLVVETIRAYEQRNGSGWRS